MGEELKLSKLMALLVNDQKKDLESLLTEDNLYNSNVSAYLRKIRPNLNYLDYEKAVYFYGTAGVSRFYKGLFSAIQNETEPVEKESFLDRLLYRNRPKPKTNLKETIGEALTWVAFPFKIMSRIYDYILDKTDSHLLAYGAGVASFFETFLLGEYLGFSAYISYAYQMPISDVLSQTFPFFGPTFLFGGLLYGAFGAGFIAGITFLERRLFNRNYVSQPEVESDISKLAEDFQNVWDRYAGLLTKQSDKQVTLGKLNAMYTMVTSNNSLGSFSNRKDLKYHELRLLPSIEKAIGKKVSIRSIIHRCFDGVGGMTLFPSMFIGLLSRNHALGPIFVNKNRINSNPSYDFAVSHEFAHAAGAASEPMANYYALKAMDDLAERYPLVGYDLYAATNRLCFAVGALREKVKDTEEFISILRELRVPKFVFKAFTTDFQPGMSPFPPMENLEKGPIESKFSGLYIVSSYIASKMVKNGKKKLFHNLRAYN